VSFNAGDIEGSVVLNRDPFIAGLRLARREGEEFERKHFTATLDADSTTAHRKVGGLYSDLRKMAEARTAPHIDVDTAGATRGIMGVRRQLAALPDPTVTIHVATARVAAGIVGVLRQVASFRVTAIASLVALVPAAVGAATAVGGIGVAALGILGPIGLLGLAMHASFKRGGPSIKALQEQLGHLRGAFEYATGPATRAAFGGITVAVKDLTSVLPGLRENFTGLGKAAGASFRSLGNQLSSVSFRDFYATMFDTATKALPLLTRSLRSLLDIFKNLATAGAPLLLKGLRNLAVSLKDIAGRTSDIGAMRAAMDKGATAAGKLWQIGKNLAGVLKGIFSAAATGSNSFLDSIQKATKSLGVFFQSKDGQEVLKDTLSALSLYIKEIAGAIPTLIKAFGTLLDIVTPLFKVAIGLAKALTAIPGIGPGLAAVAVGFIAWKGPLGVASSLLRGLPALLGRVKAARVTGSLIPLVPGGIGSRATAASKGGNAASSLGSLAGMGGSAAKEGEAASKGFLARFGAGLKGGWPKITAGLKGMLGKFGPLLTKIPGLAGIGSIFASAFSGIGPKMGGVVAKGFGLLGRLLPNILKTVGKVLLRGVGGWPLLVASLIWMLLPKKVKDAIIGALKDAGKWIFNALKTAGKAIGEAALWIMKTLGKGLIAWYSLPVKAVIMIGEKIWGVIKEIGPKFLEAGKAIIRMLVNGIKSQIGVVVDAVKSVIGAARDLLPFSEPKNHSSPLFGLGKSGEAMMTNLGAGVWKGQARLRKQVVAALEAAYAPIRTAAQSQLHMMDVQDANMQGPPQTRAQQQADVYARISAARGATDDQGRLLNLPPPGVQQRPDKEEQDALDELRDLQRGFLREDLQARADVNVNMGGVLIPTDPNTIRGVQRGIAKAVKQGSRLRPKKKRLA
jgi:hypothetical protein